jgi:hypothetical protein
MLALVWTSKRSFRLISTTNNLDEPKLCLALLVSQMDAFLTIQHERPVCDGFRLEVFCYRNYAQM